MPRFVAVGALLVGLVAVRFILVAGFLFVPGIVALSSLVSLSPFLLESLDCGNEFWVLHVLLGIEHVDQRFVGLGDRPGFVQVVFLDLLERLEDFSNSVGFLLEDLGSKHSWEQVDHEGHGHLFHGPLLGLEAVVAYGGGVVVSVWNGDPVHRVRDLLEFLVNVGQERSQGAIRRV